MGYLRDVNHCDRNKLTFKQLIYLIHIIGDPNSQYSSSIFQWRRSFSPIANTQINCSADDFVLKRSSLYEIDRVLGVNETSIKANQLIDLWKDIIGQIVKEEDEEI